MNTISNTAWYCCGVRMEDAAGKHPVCNDHYANRFMDKNGLKIYEPFKSETMPNISNITRCRIIDDFIRRELEKNRNIDVISIGAGFDTRPYRLNGGVWAEVDEPQIIEYKNSKLPVQESGNPLQRISINFSSESLKDKLLSMNIQHPPVIVIEGVFMYLTPEAIYSTIKTLQELYPEHILLCDLINRVFFNRFAYKIHEKLVAAGGTFTERPEKPDEIFTGNGYRKTEEIPMYKRAAELGVIRDRLNVPGPLFKLMVSLFMKDLYGYTVARFEFG